MASETILDVRGEIRQAVSIAEERVVAAPLHYLHAVDLRLDSAERHIEHGDSLSRAAQHAPERIALHERARGAVFEAIAPRHELHLVV